MEISEKFDGIKRDDFEKRAAGWIWNELGEHKFYAGELTITAHKETLSRIEFNVIDAYRDLIRFPDKCPGCTRSGRDHDMECPTPNWKGKDFGTFNN
jgi:hypothetical protein